MEAGITLAGTPGDDVVVAEHDRARPAVAKQAIEPREPECPVDRVAHDRHAVPGGVEGGSRHWVNRTVSIRDTQGDVGKQNLVTGRDHLEPRVLTPVLARAISAV